jgi:MAS20 protein import receptor
MLLDPDPFEWDLIFYCPLLTYNLGSDNVEAALSFYKALKVYPTPSELISIYDKTVTKVLASLQAHFESVLITRIAGARPTG